MHAGKLNFGKCCSMMRNRCVGTRKCLVYLISSHPACLNADILRHIDVGAEDEGRSKSKPPSDSPLKRSIRYSLRRIEGMLAEGSESSKQRGEENEGEPDTMDESFTINFTRVEKRDVAAAFRILAATRSPDKEGNNFGAAANRDDASVSALAFVRNIESSVVGLIAQIGDIVVNGEHAGIGSSRRQSTRLVRGDAVFEYFCERKMINMLVDIVKEKRSSGNNTTYGLALNANAERNM